MSSSASSRDSESLETIQRHIWTARVPLEVRLASSESRLYDKSESYLIYFPRLAYLPFLLPRLLAFYSDDLIADVEELSAESGYFTFEDIPLKWHLPVGLLYDIHILSTQDVVADDTRESRDSSRNARPLVLTVHFSNPTSESKLNLVSPSGAIVHDAFINSVKEADFLRSGSAKPIMSLNATDSKALWTSTQQNDLSTWDRIHSSLLPITSAWRNIPIRIFLPSTSTSDSILEGNDTKPKEQDQKQGQIRVIQSQIPRTLATQPSTTTTASQLRTPSSQSQSQTIGTALHALLPGLFPSRRTPILAKPLLHGAPVPMNAVLEELASKACYADGWLNIVVAVSS